MIARGASGVLRFVDIFGYAMRYAKVTAPRLHSASAFY